MSVGRVDWWNHRPLRVADLVDQAIRYLADHVADILLRRGDLDVHDRLLQHRIGLLHRLLEGEDAGLLAEQDEFPPDVLPPRRAVDATSTLRLRRHAQRVVALCAGRGRPAAAFQ
mgnify:CR=1 FL=1